MCVTVLNKLGCAAEDFDLLTIALLSATQLGAVAQGEAITFTVQQFVRYQAALWPLPLGIKIAGWLLTTLN